MRLRNYIGGQWQDGAGPLDQDGSPSQPDRVLADFCHSTREDVDRAITAAEAAFLEWATTPAPQRGRILYQFHRILSEHRSQYVDLMMAEQGKTRPEAVGEFQKGLNLVEFFAGEGFRLNGETIPSEVGKTFTYTLREPLGPVALITPWNFPFAIPIWKMCPALVAGNTVVFKPASYTPWIGVRLVEDLVAAGLPPGVVNLVLGSGSVAGETVATDPRIRALSFTGSNGVGQHLAELLAGRPLKITMEMGGKNAVVVAPSADLDLAASGVVQGAFGAAGQRCTATSRVFVHQSVLAEFRAACLERASQVVVASPDDPTSTMGPLISSSQLEKSLQFIEAATREGARVALGGRSLDRPGYFLEPTILEDVTRDMAVVNEEVFGPVLVLMSYETFEDAVSLVNAVLYGLSAAIYTRDLKEAQEFIRQAAVGMVHVNNPTIGGEAQLPFGGIKASGLGPREMGHEGTLFFTETKTVFMDYSGSGRSGNLY